MKIHGNGQAEPLTKTQFNTVLNNLRGAYRMAFALCWYTTERPGAILQLDVEDCYTSNDKRRPRETIVIARAKRKDRRTREAPVTTGLAAELRLYDAPAWGPLFPSDSQSGHLSYRAYYNALSRAFAQLGMTGYSPYSTRRGALTHLLKKGISTKRIQELSGHASLASLQPYLESSEAEKRRTAELL
ncbi:MAG: tyrosine-type recombinase/integrase [Spirulina sp.]